MPYILVISNYNNTSVVIRTGDCVLFALEENAPDALSVIKKGLFMFSIISVGAESVCVSSVV